MDNIAHALVGAVLGRAIADRRMPAPALTGAVVANAPDWTELFIGLPSDGANYLVLHRGITHSLAGAAVQIALLAALIQVGGAWWARRQGASAPAWPWVTSAVAACVLSHLYMDWQGSYGLRPLLPWNGQWYYGDFVAIVDVFFWFVPLVALAWGSHRHWRPAAGFAVPAILLFAMLLAAGTAASWVKLAAATALATGAAGWTSHWFGVARRRRAAVYGLALLAAYAGAQALASLGARAGAGHAAAARFGPGATSAVLTIAGQPFAWEPMYASADTVVGPGWEEPRGLDDPRVRKALRLTREGRAMAGFARFLTATVDSAPDGVWVVLRDARYARAGDRGWGVLSVSLPSDPAR